MINIRNSCGKVVVENKDDRFDDFSVSGVNHTFVNGPSISFLSGATIGKNSIKEARYAVISNSYCYNGVEIEFCAYVYDEEYQTLFDEYRRNGYNYNGMKEMVVAIFENSFKLGFDDILTLVTLVSLKASNNGKRDFKIWLAKFLTP